MRPVHQLLHAPDIWFQVLKCLEYEGAVCEQPVDAFDGAVFHFSRRNTHGIGGARSAPSDQTSGNIVAISLAALERMRRHQTIASLVV